MKGDLVCVLRTLKNSVGAIKDIFMAENSAMEHYAVKSETFRAYKDGQCAAFNVVSNMIEKIEEELCSEEEDDK